MEKKEVSFRLWLNSKRCHQSSMKNNKLLSLGFSGCRFWVGCLMWHQAQCCCSYSWSWANPLSVQGEQGFADHRLLGRCQWTSSAVGGTLSCKGICSKERLCVFSLFSHLQIQLLEQAAAKAFEWEDVMLWPLFERISSPYWCLSLGFSCNVQGTVQTSIGKERIDVWWQLGTSKMVIIYIPQSLLPAQVKTSSLIL